MRTLKLHLNWLLSAQLISGLVLAAVGLWLTNDADIENKPQPTATQVAQPGLISPESIPSFRLPAGGDQIFPNHRLIALYGSPGEPVLGALGHQNMQQSIQRVKNLAKQYQPYMDEHTLPTFEIIATVASAHPTDNHDYSSEISPAVLQKWIAAAREAGVYVVLDLQSGRSDFLSQAKQLEPLLRQPNVGLALDPEWRLEPHQRPIEQIGAVSVKEVNQTANWLATLTRQYHLPQKVFLLHQFRLDMLPNRHKLDTSHPELAYAIQMDGQGTQSQKQDTWRAILKKAPANIKFGWKNFYAKDSRVLTPKQTMHIKPRPWFVSYQ